MNSTRRSIQKSLMWIRKILHCETIEQCRRIQRGSVLFRRLGKLCILASVGTTLFVGDCVAATIKRLQHVEAVTTTFLYRWTVGWYEPPSTIDWSLVAIWKLIDTAQFIVFLVLVVLAVRWVYADCVASGTRWLGFAAQMAVAFVTNFAVYLVLRSYCPV
jgi:hypothetical protein